MTMNNPMQMFQMQINQMLGQIQQNPSKFLAKKFNVPQNVTEPQDIIQHLLNSGQTTQAKVNWAMQMKKQFFGN